MDRMLFLACCLAGLLAELAFGQENLALNKVVIKTQEDIPVIRGELLDQNDPIDATCKTINSDRSAIEIIRVGNAPGESDYESKKDFSVHNGWMIQWLPGGKHPGPGATYFVSGKYVASEQGHNTTGHGGYLTDGTRSHWRAKAPTWIYVDLSGERAIGRVVVKQEGGTNYISEKITIQFAKSGAGDLNKDTSWENVIALDAKVRNPLENVIEPIIDFKIQPVKSRYFRLVVEKGCPVHGYAYISELELYPP